MLAGLEILVARAGPGGTDYVAALSVEGAIATTAHLLKISPPEDPAPLNQCVAALNTYDWVVFTSVNTVRAVAGGAQGAMPLVRPNHVAAIGPATTAALNHIGWVPDVVPQLHDASGLVTAMRAIEPGTLLLPQSIVADSMLEDGLAGAGFTVTRVTAYRSVVDEQAVAKTVDLLRSRTFDNIVFMSPSALQALLDALGSTETFPPAICIGRRTAEACVAAGMRVAAIAPSPTPKGVVAALKTAHRS